MPYGRGSDAVAGNESVSPYIRRVNTDWERSEAEGNVSFSSRFSMPTAWLNRQVIVRVGPVASAYELRINGEAVGYTQSGAVATEFNVTKAVVEDRNGITLTCIGDAAGAGMRPAGRIEVPDVRIVSQPSLRVRDVIVRTRPNNAGASIAEVGVAMKCNTLNPRTSRLQLTLSVNDSTVLLREYRDLTLDMRREDTLRFTCRVPDSLLWSPAAPRLLRLELENTVDGRRGESLAFNVGLRTLCLQEGSLYVNGDKIELRAAEYDGTQTPERLLPADRNCLVVTNGNAPDWLYDECDRQGVLVLSRAAVDTTPFGKSVARGGNPTNDPLWGAMFRLRNEDNLYSVRLHPSVVGLMLGKGTTTGVNVYDTYLHMKSVAGDLPVIYSGAGGEWCTDVLSMK